MFPTFILGDLLKAVLGFIDKAKKNHNVTALRIASVVLIILGIVASKGYFGSFTGEYQFIPLSIVIIGIVTLFGNRKIPGITLLFVILGFVLVTFIVGLKLYCPGWKMMNDLNKLSSPQLLNICNSFGFN